MMKKVYGDDCLSRSRIHEWFKRFQEGQGALEDDGIKNILSVDLSYFDRKFGLHKGLCQI